MTRFADELCGSEGERAKVGGAPVVIVAVHDGGEKATVQYVQNNECRVLHHTQIELEGHEKDVPSPRDRHNARECWCGIDHSKGAGYL